MNIEQGVHIVSHCDIRIGDNVSIAPYCVILDVGHPADNPDGAKMGDLLTSERSHVHIGAGTMLGANCTILPNVSIGRGCILGAGSVLRQDLPDFTMAAGNPARIIAVFDTQTRRWS